LEPDPASPCVFTRGTLRAEHIHCPVAHGEGRFVPCDQAKLEHLRANHQIALTYTRAEGGPAAYPDNPNGSVANIAGICNERGNVLGLMPHPEDHTILWQHPHWTRDAPGRGNMGLALFERGVRYAAEI
jgi:phosphoribosylformylglycinamidine synthase